MSTNILITGGTGMVGQRLTSLLTSRGFEVAHLSRKNSSTIKTFLWDPSAEQLDDNALEFADVVVHLAGAGIADSRWTDSRKQILRDSRIKSAGLIRKRLNQLGKSLDLFVSASAIGYYGAATGDKVLDEEAAAGDDFLGGLCARWEDETKHFDKWSAVRVGIVLGPEGGAIEKMAMPVKMGLGAPLASGSQKMSWIHIDDLCAIILFIIENQITGIFNATASVNTNREVTSAIAKSLNRPMFLPNVPAWALRLMLGQMSEMLVGGNHVVSNKIREQGFVFKHENLESTLKDIF